MVDGKRGIGVWAKWECVFALRYMTMNRAFSKRGLITGNVVVWKLLIIELYVSLRIKIICKHSAKLQWHVGLGSDNEYVLTGFKLINLTIFVGIL